MAAPANCPHPIDGSCPADGSVTVYAGDQTRIMALNEGFAMIRILNPRVANVKAFSDHRFSISGLSFGQTRIRFYDDAGALIGDVSVSVRRPPGQIVIIDRPHFGETDYGCNAFGCEFQGVNMKSRHR